MKHNQEKRRRLIELGKDILIVLLLISACLLALRTQFVDLGAVQSPTRGQSGTQTDTLPETGHPIRINARVESDGSNTLFTTGYRAVATETAFQHLSALFYEALGSMESAVAITEAQFQAALLTAPGFHFDLSGVMPLSALSQHLATQQWSAQAVSVCQLVLTVWDGETVVVYQNIDDGKFYTSSAPNIIAERIQTASAEFSGQIAQYAFQMEGYEQLSPYTLILAETPQLPEYTFANPMVSEENVQTVLNALGFPQNSSRYETTSEWVIRSGGDTLRLSYSGVLTYTKAESGALHFPVTAESDAPTQFEQIAACRRLVRNTIGLFVGEARIHLLSAEETDGTLFVEFGYFLDGASVQLSDGGYAARLTVDHGQITQLVLHFCEFTATADTSLLLPLPQVMGAMQSLEIEGWLMAPAYRSEENNRLVAQWSVVNR